jgi:hypothetical protein
MEWMLEKEQKSDVMWFGWIWYDYGPVFKCDRVVTACGCVCGVAVDLTRSGVVEP